MWKKTKRKRSRRTQQYDVIWMAIRRAMRCRKKKQKEAEKSA